MQEHSYDIAQFIAALSEIPSSDPLVHVEASSAGLLLLQPAASEAQQTFPLDGKWNALLKTAVQNKREADLDSLCRVFGQIAWEYKGKTVHSPLILVPVAWKTPKGKQQVELRTDPEQAFVNPFVRHSLQRTFGLTLEENTGSPETLLAAIAQAVEQEQLPVGITPFSGIGNFHHHRYQVLRELELIRQSSSLSPLVATILGEETVHTNEHPVLAEELLSPADADQLQVFRQVARENTVIQGPPGTGKSQVLTNLIGKSLVGEGFTLVVSEKRVALEVLVKKLAESGLDTFTYTAHSQSQPKTFIHQLKTAWNELEQDAEPVPPSLLLSDQLKASLQLLMDRLNSPNLPGGISFADFRELLLTSGPAEAAFHSDVPSIPAWLAVQPDLQELETVLGSFGVLRPYKQLLLADAQFDRMLRKLEQETDFALEQFSAGTVGELENIYKSAARCQLVLNEAFRSYFELHQKPRERKRFDKARLAFRDLTARLEVMAAEERLWKRTPSRSEATSWLVAAAGKQSWFARRKGRRSIEAALTDPATDPKTALENWLLFLDLQEALAAVRRQLAEWGIERPEVELESAAYVLRQLEQEDANELNRVAALPTTEKQRIIAHADRLKHLLQDLNRYLFVSAETDLRQLFRDTDTVIGQLLAGIPVIARLPEAVYRLIATGKPLREIHAIVLHSNRRLLETRFPELARFDGETLTARLADILATEQEEFALFARKIRQLRKQRFEEYATLLRTPAARLKGPEKELKARLKAGKAILVKEFGKSKQHQTIRELLSGDARTWIELLTPVWLSTPAQIGKTFPMEQQLFGLTIFDEASQIPLPNALGALQRSKRAVVAGDEQQMAPSSYFSGGTAMVDLLHQASFYWKKVPLRHHYRSEHPALIAFSNKHFYNNELVAYPSAKAQYPLFRHFVPNGSFDERTNPEEAKAVATFLETVNWKKSVGIVAFSEQQLECIWQQCSPAVQEKITAGQEKNTVFFKALEQIQGDEADHVVIGLGYGKNPDGAFHLRFGPLNQSQGYKRLNVLLTRAKSELHFFTSVAAADFTVSSNESVNLLRLFLAQLEQQHTAAELILPYGLLPVNQTASSMTLKAVYEHIPSAQELVTFHRVMKARGWLLNYE
jgi:hypothetical protein